MKTTAKCLPSLGICFRMMLIGSLAGRALAEPTPQPYFPAGDKSSYNLFNRTPTNLWRPLDNDFGAMSPHTVDAGVITLRMSLDYDYRDWSRNGVDRTSQKWNIGSTWLTAGLTKDLDFELGLPMYQLQRDTFKDAFGKDSRTDTSFMNSFTTRARYNLWGNDGGQTSMALLGTMMWPIDSCDDYEGGLSALFSYRTSCNADMRFNTGILFRQNNDGWNTIFDNRISVSHALVGNLSGLVAFDAQYANTRHADWNTAIETGLIYKATPDFQIFLGTGFGLSGRSSDYSPKLSFVSRF